MPQGQEDLRQTRRSAARKTSSCSPQSSSPATPRPGLATLAATGIGFDVRAAECHGLGVASLDGIGAVGTCLARQHECRVEQALEAALPRLLELLDHGQVSLP